MKLLSLLLIVPLALELGAASCCHQHHCAWLTTSCSSDMDDKQQIEAIYRRMYSAMIAKDTLALDSLLDDEATLVHMTGVRQPKRGYIRSIADGTLNYYAADHDRILVSVDGSQARLTGQSRVSAAVYGGGRHTWRLQIAASLVKADGQWRFLEMVASTY